MNRVDNTGEFQTELLTAALLLIVGVGFLLGRIDDPLAMLLAGLILLGSGIYQSSRGWHVAVTTWVLGAILTLGGLGMRMFLVTFMEINFVALGVIAVGAFLVWRTFMRRPR